ncbi:MAG: acetyltransferase [Flavobacteriaceae bacterium]
MKDISLYGAGGHCYAVVELIKSLGIYSPSIIYDDNPKKTEILNIPVNIFNKDLLDENVVISIGNNRNRKNIASQLKNKKFPSFIHNSAVFYSSSTIGFGTLILPGSVIDADVKIKDFCIINNNATISHNVRIDSFVHIAINSAIAGGVEIGEGTLIGSGAIILPEIKIGKWVTIGAGAVVTKDIPDNALAYGNPARIVKNNK